MKRYREFIGRYYESLHGACLCTGFLLLADSFWNLNWPSLLLTVCAVLFYLLLRYAVQKHVVIPAGFILVLLHFAILLFFHFTRRDSYPFLTFLTMEAACIAASVYCFYAVRHLYFSLPLLGAELTCLIYYGAEGIPLSKWIICLVFFCCMIFLAEAAGTKKGVEKQNVFFLAPLFLVSLLLLCLLPVKDTPIRWERIRSAAAAVQEKAAALFVSLDYLFSGTTDTYSLSRTGYSPDGNLGGSLLQSDKAQISVTGDRTKSPLYLKGTVYDTYTGTSWEPNAPSGKSGTTEYLEQYRNINEVLAGSGLTDEEIRSLTHLCTLDIKFEGLKTKSLFHAPNTWRFYLPDALEPDTFGGSILLPKAKGVGFSYELQFLEINYKSDAFQKLLAQAQNAHNKSAPPLAMAKSCTALPDDLPLRVFDLAEEITKGCQTPYEELEAIRTYLSSYQYTTITDAPKEGRDFADAFLFDTKEGYCTSFATAMAILGRCRNIPTRYVEGFATDRTCGTENKEIHLGGSSAHAWMEAYLEPMGWIPFDPTPGYAYGTASGWEENPPEDTAPAAAPGTAGSKEDLHTQDSEEHTPAENQQTAAVIYKGVLHTLLKLLPFLILLSAACILGTAVLLFRKFMRSRAYTSMDDYKKTLFLMDKLFQLGKLWKIPFCEGETLLEYEKKAAGALDTPEAALSDLFGIFRHIRYGGQDASPKTILYMETYIRSLEMQYLNNCSRTGRMLYRLR